MQICYRSGCSPNQPHICHVQSWNWSCCSNIHNWSHWTNHSCFSLEKKQIWNVPYVLSIMCYSNVLLTTNSTASTASSSFTWYIWPIFITSVYQQCKNRTWRTTSNKSFSIHRSHRAENKNQKRSPTYSAEIVEEVEHFTLGPPFCTESTEFVWNPCGIHSYSSPI